MNYIYSLALLFSGLFLVNLIFSYQSKHIDPAFWETLKFQLLVLPLFLTANMLIGYGVKFGFKTVDNLTYVLVTSKGIEILISLMMGYMFLKEIPTWKTLLGFSIIIVGLIISKIK
jgi:drug/metabolite transporter (DMT)-like permease